MTSKKDNLWIAITFGDNDFYYELEEIGALLKTLLMNEMPISDIGESALECKLECELKEIVRSLNRLHNALAGSNTDSGDYLAVNLTVRVGEKADEYVEKHIVGAEGLKLSDVYSAKHLRGMWGNSEVLLIHASKREVDYIIV